MFKFWKRKKIETLDSTNHQKQTALNEFPGSANYWNSRYKRGGNSGAGSYNRLADFKAKVLNEFCDHNNIQKVIEFGCGDGNQLSLANYKEYIGFDVAQKSIDLCREKFDESPGVEAALTLSSTTT